MEDDEEDSTKCSAIFFKEFKPENIAPTHRNAKLFIDSQWTTGRLSLAYVIYRLVVAILVISWVVADFLHEAGKWYSDTYYVWLVFATNWSLLALCISCVLMSIATTYYYIRTRQYAQDLPRPIPCGLSTLWLMYNIACNSALVVSISFWSFVIIIDGDDIGFLTNRMSQLKHTLNTVYVIIDMFINAVPIRIYHLIYPLTCGIVYAIFNAAYFINDGVGFNDKPYAYDVMDWRNPLGSAITCVLGFVLCCLVQFVLYGLYMARLCFYRRLMFRLTTDLDEMDAGLTKNDGNERDSIFPNRLDSPDGVVHGTNYRSVDEVELNSSTR